MSRRGWRLAVVSTVAALSIAGALAWRLGRPDDGLAIGGRVGDFALIDALGGRRVSLADYRGKSAVVLAFTGVDCPVGELYLPRLADLERRYRSRGVGFLGIDANAHDEAAEIARDAHAHGVEFPILRDDGAKVADALGAARTSEVLLLDAGGRLRYRGPVDDQYERGVRREKPAHHLLADALDAVLAGSRVRTPSAPVVGCPIDRESPQAVAGRVKVRTPPAESRPPVEVGDVTYSADVSPILRDRCQSCHRPGQVAPFSLLTYEQARRRAAAIREAVADRQMPPWHADPRYGHFANDRSLSARDRAVLLAWVDQGAPAGPPSTGPLPPPYSDGWTIGAPDLVFEMPAPYAVPAEGTVNYRRFRVPSGFAEDRWVSAAEARAGDKAVVHHIGVYVDDPAHPAARNMKPAVAVYFPGEHASIFPEGTARRIPTGSTLVFEVHYTPIGVPRTDRSSLGLIFAKGPVRHEAVTKGIPARDLVIPAGASSHEVRSSTTFDRGAHLLGMMPHMHLRGKDFRFTAVYPDGRREVLLSVPAYDFGWQSLYRLAEPVALPAGTRLECVAHFDNSAANPANPDPGVAVRWGEQTWDEMMIGYYDYRDDAPIAARDPGDRVRR